MSEKPISTNPAMPVRQNTLAGIFWLGFSGLLFVGVTGIVRHLGHDIPPIEAAFIRYCFGILLIVPLIIRLRLKVPRGRKLMLYSARGIAHAIAVSLWFFAMARIPIADVIAIGYTVPIFVTIAAALFLGERLRIHRVLAVIAGFIGTMIILRPGLVQIEIGALAQFLAAPAFATSFILAKVLTRDEHPVAVVVMLSIFCTLALAPGAILQWQTPSLVQFFWLAVVAAFATLGHYAQTRSFQCAPITATQPVWFLQIVWGALMGYFLFNETPDPWVIVGALIIIFSVGYITHRENRKKAPQIKPLNPET